MEKDKYYIPDIEDFRIGYEYEKSNDENKSEWRVEIKDWDFEGLDFYLREGMIRVPYLTQEQIEAEGWNDGVKANKKGYIYSYIYEDRQLTIKKLANCPFPDEIVFSGECKSVNELRYISKLLKI